MCRGRLRAAHNKKALFTGLVVDGYVRRHIAFSAFGKALGSARRLLFTRGAPLLDIIIS
jgi:hypothetical protein